MNAELIQTIERLTGLGFELWAENGKIKMQHPGNGIPARVLEPLLAPLRNNRDEALALLEKQMGEEDLPLVAELAPSSKAHKYENSDLFFLAGGRYKIAIEESWCHERPEVRGPDRRWYLQIPCKGEAFISLYSETPKVILRLYTPRVRNAKEIWAEIGEHMDCRGDFHMNGEADLFFPPELLHRVAKMARARRKRQGRKLTPEERANLLEAGRAFRFRPGSTGLEVQN